MQIRLVCNIEKNFQEIILAFMVLLATLQSLPTSPIKWVSWHCITDNITCPRYITFPRSSDCGARKKGGMQWRNSLKWCFFMLPSFCFPQLGPLGLTMAMAMKIPQKQANGIVCALKILVHFFAVLFTCQHDN